MIFKNMFDLIIWLFLLSPYIIRFLKFLIFLMHVCFFLKNKQRKNIFFIFRDANNTLKKYFGTSGIEEHWNFFLILISTVSLNELFLFFFKENQSYIIHEIFSLTVIFSFLLISFKITLFKLKFLKNESLLPNFAKFLFFYLELFLLCMICVVFFIFTIHIFSTFFFKIDIISLLSQKKIF